MCTVQFSSLTIVDRDVLTREAEDTIVLLEAVVSVMWNESCDALSSVLAFSEDPARVAFTVAAVW